jgi:hypothetical protein
MTKKQLIEKGYFPKELPPPFTTILFANAATNSVANLRRQYFPNTISNYTSKPIVHNLARAGTLRRKLAIPNPLSFHELSLFVENNWTQLNQSASSSKISYSSPTPDPNSPRALSQKYNFNILPFARANVRSGMRYILRTDINSFYPSIYSHSIPWAIHTKPIAKADRSLHLLGNQLDKIIRNGQDRQTIGIPIGPDTSLLIAEILLSDIDSKLPANIIPHAFRYIDDYEIGFSTLADAESTLAVLQSLLAEYELQLNPRKTGISELPQTLEYPWVPELRSQPIRSSQRSQATDILSLVNKALYLMPTYIDQSVLKYTLSRLKSVPIATANWPFYQDILLQCAVIEPGTLDVVIGELQKYQAGGMQLNRTNISETFESIILHHAPLEHGSETAWAVWGSILFNIDIGQNATNVLTQTEDSIVALLCLFANSKGLLHNSADFNKWANLMTTSELCDSQWLLAYEAKIQGWLPSLNVADHIGAHSYFSWLEQSGVSFFDINAVNTTALQEDIVEYGAEDEFLSVLGFSQ